LNSDTPVGRYARVVVGVGPAHLDRPFDYSVPDGMRVGVGSQVRVVFAGRRRTGWVVETGDEPHTAPERIRALSLVQGELAWFDAADLALYRWVADRYAAKLADVLRHALPQRVAGVERESGGWGPPAVVERAARPACPSPAWRPYGASALLQAAARPSGQAYWLRVLPDGDAAALVADLIMRCLGAGKGVLVLGPDPASQLPDAALAVTAGADWRADNARDRYRAFLRGRTGHARVAVGERAAVFAPVADLGLVVVDDEANPAYKERRSPRHHAREVALARARMAGATCVLLADLPSANLYKLLRAGHVTAVATDRATQRRHAPRVDVVDLSDPRPGTRRARFAEPAARALSAVVRDAGAAVVLASRGGQGAALACRGCRRRLTCPNCQGWLSVVAGDGGWRCPSCGWTGPAFPCPDCGDHRAVPLAAGAARLASELARSHASAEVVRMEGFDAEGPESRPAIGVMTRGSVVSRPAWLGPASADLTVLPDADAMLGRPVLDAAEDALRLWLAAARWSRRVVLQTREPGHHAVQALVRSDPLGFWQRETRWRAQLRYPPAASLVRVALRDAQTAAAVAVELRGALPAGDEVLGPDLAHELIVKCDDLRGTLSAIAPLRHAWSNAGRTVRLDVDPLL
jgi:primosomal protein N' (replication factor Y)